jgi:hypothetical protein
LIPVQDQIRWMVESPAVARRFAVVRFEACGLFVLTNQERFMADCEAIERNGTFHH